jgi:hypothetical protein
MGLSPVTKCPAMLLHLLTTQLAEITATQRRELKAYPADLQKKIQQSYLRVLLLLECLLLHLLLPPTGRNPNPNWQKQDPTHKKHPEACIARSTILMGPQHSQAAAEAAQHTLNLIKKSASSVESTASSTLLTGPSPS